MASATITSKGQVTIPKKIREYLKAEKGARIEFIIDSDGKVTLMPVSEDVQELKYMIPLPPKPVSLADMEQAIEEEGGRG